MVNNAKKKNVISFYVTLTLKRFFKGNLSKKGM